MLLVIWSVGCTFLPLNEISHCHLMTCSRLLIGSFPPVQGGSSRHDIFPSGSTRTRFYLLNQRIKKHVRGVWHKASEDSTQLQRQRPSPLTFGLAFQSQSPMLSPL